ncbi:MAG: SPOR domain-containing protein [candidate division Zixibacteria bacterium]|nr:SPOR domain-containing protein [candidate division Zixibacteria bacterium]
MKYMRLLAVFCLACLVVNGCSKKQEEADKLEQEMMAQETAVDSAAVDTSSAGERAALDAAAVPREEPSPFVPVDVEGEGYTVQVASCESLDYARHLVQVYADRGYEPYLTQFEFEGQLYYRVRVGKFENNSRAAALKAELIDKYSVDAWVDVL